MWGPGLPCRGLLLTSLTALLALSPAHAQDSSADSAAPPTLEELQERISALEKGIGKTPTIGSSDVTMKIFGRLHLEFWNFIETDRGTNVLENGEPNADPVNSWEFRRARIGMSGKIYDDMKYKLEIDFGKPDGLVYKDMFFAFSDVPVLKELRIGNQKRP